MPMPTNLESLRAQVAILRHVKAKRAELSELEANARAAVEEALGEDTEGTIDGVTVIKWSRSKRTSLNQKLLKELYPEIAAECQDTIEVRRLLVLEDD